MPTAFPALPLVLFALLLLAACAPGRVVEAQRLLSDVAAGDGPSALKEATPAPERRPVAFTDGGRRGELYSLPGQPARAGLVLVPGVTPQGLDDPRLVAFANSLARVGFTVLVPDIPSLRRLRVAPSDAEPIAEAALALSDGGVEGLPAMGEVGVAAISYAAGPAVLAALQPEAGERIGLLVLVGGYHDIEALVIYFTTGRYREGPDAPWRRGDPNPRAKWIFLEANAGQLAETRDRALLAEIARRKLEDRGAGIRELAGRLGPDGQAVLALIENRDPEAVPGLIEALPPALLEDLVGLDLARRDLSKLEAELILIHGRQDPVIPYTESEALAEAAGSEEISLYLPASLDHVDLGPTDATDVVRLWGAAYDLLAARDRLAAD